MPDPSPTLSHYVDAIDARFDRNDIESIWNCRTVFAGLVESGIATRALNDELRRLGNDVSYIGDWRPNHLILHRGEGFILSVAYFERPHRYIHTSPFYGFYAPLDDQPLIYERFALPEHYRNDVFDPSLRITSAGLHRVEPGELLELHTERAIYDIDVARPQLILKLTTAAYHTLEWLFTRDTLSAWQANDSDLRSTQLRVSAYLLGRLGDESSVDSLRQLASHANHSARWAAIQAIGRLSRSEGLLQLEKAVNDPHPHIRRAAQKALGMNKVPKSG